MKSSSLSSSIHSTTSSKYGGTMTDYDDNDYNGSSVSGRVLLYCSDCDDDFAGGGDCISCHRIDAVISTPSFVTPKKRNSTYNIIGHKEGNTRCSMNHVARARVDVSPTSRILQSLSGSSVSLSSPVSSGGLLSLSNHDRSRHHHNNHNHNNRRPLLFLSNSYRKNNASCFIVQTKGNNNDNYFCYSYQRIQRLLPLITFVVTLLIVTQFTNERTGARNLALSKQLRGQISSTISSSSRIMRTISTSMDSIKPSNNETSIVNNNNASTEESANNSRNASSSSGGNIHSGLRKQNQMADNSKETTNHKQYTPHHGLPTLHSLALLTKGNIKNLRNDLFYLLQLSSTLAKSDASSATAALSISHEKSTKTAKKRLAPTITTTLSSTTAISHAPPTSKTATVLTEANNENNTYSMEQGNTSDGLNVNRYNENTNE